MAVAASDRPLSSSTHALTGGSSLPPRSFVDHSPVRRAPPSIPFFDFSHFQIARFARSIRTIFVGTFASPSGTTWGLLHPSRLRENRRCGNSKLSSAGVNSPEERGSELVRVSSLHPALSIPPLWRVLVNGVLVASGIMIITDDCISM